MADLRYDTLTTRLAMIRSRLLALLALVTLALAGPVLGQDASPAIQRLEREIVRLAKGAGGTVGVGAIHVESGRRVSLNPGDRFPMASSYKVPIAIQLLQRVDDGDFKLSDMAEITPRDLHPGSGTLTDLFNQPGVLLSFRNLLELMLLISDNSATDVLLRAAGGPEKVTARMRALGIDGIEVSRPTALLIAHFNGLTDIPPEEEWNPAMWSRLFREVKPEVRREAVQRYYSDPRDSSTPLAMAQLLEKLHRGQVLKPETNELLLNIMRRCRTGEGRLKGMLPAGTLVAHKTGTVGGTTNDVGIITLPDGAGHVAIAVFVKASEAELTAREKAIAEIARGVYDFFLFNP